MTKSMNTRFAAPANWIKYSSTAVVFSQVGLGGLKTEHGDSRGNYADLLSADSRGIDFKFLDPGSAGASSKTSSR